MNLQNGYKVIYEKAADGKRTFYASKSGYFADAEELCSFVIGNYKLIYEKNGKFYGSESGIPTTDDYCFTEFDKIFVAEETADTSNSEVTDQTENEDGDEPQVDQTTSESTTNDDGNNTEDTPVVDEENN